MVSTASAPPPASGPSGPLLQRSAFERSVQEQQRKGALEGALLVSRDGFPVAGGFPGLVANLEVFAAMHATALGAAEIALHGTGADPRISLVAQVGGRRFLSRGVNDSLFVVAAVPEEADCGRVFDWIDALAPGLDAQRKAAF